MIHKNLKGVTTYIDKRKSFNAIEEIFNQLVKDIDDNILEDLLVVSKIKNKEKNSTIHYSLLGETDVVSMIGLLEFLKMQIYENEAVDASIEEMYDF